MTPEALEAGRRVDRLTALKLRDWIYEHHQRPSALRRKQKREQQRT